MQSSGGGATSSSGRMPALRNSKMGKIRMRMRKHICTTWQVSLSMSQGDWRSRGWLKVTWWLGVTEGPRVTGGESRSQGDWGWLKASSQGDWGWLRVTWWLGMTQGHRVTQEGDSRSQGHSRGWLNVPGWLRKGDCVLLKVIRSLGVINGNRGTEEGWFRRLKSVSALKGKG